MKIISLICIVLSTSALAQAKNVPFNELLGYNKITSCVAKATGVLPGKDLDFSKGADPCKAFEVLHVHHCISPVCIQLMEDRNSILSDVVSLKGNPVEQNKAYRRFLNQLVLGIYPDYIGKNSYSEEPGINSYSSEYTAEQTFDGSAFSIRMDVKTSPTGEKNLKVHFKAVSSSGENFELDLEGHLSKYDYYRSAN